MPSVSPFWVWHCTSWLWSEEFIVDTEFGDGAVNPNEGNGFRLSDKVFFFVLVLTIGFAVSKRSSKNTSEYFLSGRTLPWWLLGLSMVATTFSTDTPNLVTDIVRTNGVSGNWVWWVFLLTGLLTVFVIIVYLMSKSCL